MFDVSDRLVQISGNLEHFAQRGGTMAAAEAAWLIAQLKQCAAVARQVEFDKKWAERLLDEITDEAREQAIASAPPPPPRRRRLRVIVGGRA